MSEVVVAGIALRAKSAGRTVAAIARGDGGSRPTVRQVRNDAEGRRLSLRPGVRRLAGTMAEADVQLVAIDAPLTLPHVVVCDRTACGLCFSADGTDTTFTIRRVDDAVTWAAEGFASSPMPTALLGALTFRGIYLRRALERERLTVVETWPRGVYLALGDRARDELPSAREQPDRYVAVMSERLNSHVEFEDQLTNPDEADAAAAALTAWAHATVNDRYHVGGVDGEICVCIAPLHLPSSA